MARRSRTPSGAAWPTFSLLRIMAVAVLILSFFFFSSRRRHTRCLSDWSSDVCSSDLIRKARLRDSLMAGGAAVDHVHSGEPDLINARAVIGGQPLRIRATLRKAQIRTFVLLPLAAVVLERRNGQHGQEDQAQDRKNEAHAVGYLAHRFSRHRSPKATPKTSLGRGRRCPQRSGKRRQQ